MLIHLTFTDQDDDNGEVLFCLFSIYFDFEKKKMFVYRFILFVFHSIANYYPIQL